MVANLDSSALVSALGQLRNKLLDLSGRNRLINFKHTAGKSLQFVEGYPKAIYRRLVEENRKVNILGLPEPSPSDWEERNGRQQRPDPKEWAKSMGISTSYDIPSSKDSHKSDIQSLMYPSDLAKHCRKIKREATLAIEETGANMLFLVLGFLEFPDQRNSDKTFTAPLICVPVSLQEKKGMGIQHFSLQYTGDDISENLSLQEKLRNDFGIDLPELTEEQIDVNDYFDKIHIIIEKQPRFALKHRVSLCLLSFSNMLLVRDLDPDQWLLHDEKNALIDHPIIREIFCGKTDEHTEVVDLSMAENHPVDEDPGASIPLVYDADSSQHSALVDVLALEKNLVIEGPPGTGKSQTIANLIAACLAQGKKVLFVAEKQAALEVVKNRLSQAGLDPFILELHSNKANKKRVLEEIDKRHKFEHDFQSHEILQLLQRLEKHREDLKEYADRINSVIYNAFGLSLHQVMWKAEKHRQRLGGKEDKLGQCPVHDATHISRTVFDHRLDCLKHLSSHYKSIGGFDQNCTFWGFFPEPLIPGDEVRLSRLFEEASLWSQSFVNSAELFSRLVGGKIKNISHSDSEEQLSLLERLHNDANPSIPFHIIPSLFRDDKTGTKAAKEIYTLAKQIEQFHSLEESVNTALNQESSITESKVENIRALQRIANTLGAKLGNIDELRALHQHLSNVSKKLCTANTRLIDFLNKNNIPHDGSEQHLTQLHNFANIILSAPIDHFDLQCPGLSRDGAIRALNQLLSTQKKITAIEQKLVDTLYIDTLPSEEDIKQAILALREGDAWYRIFQGRWRKATRLHKALQKIKRKISSQKRIRQLEQIINLMNLKKQWETSPIWSEFLETPVPSTQFSLDGHLALAKWNRNIKVASEDIHAELIDPATINDSQIRALRREFSAAAQDINTIISAIKYISSKLTRITEFNDDDLCNKVIEKTTEFTDALSNQFEWIEQETHHHTTFAQLIEGCEAALERKSLRSQIQANDRARSLLNSLYMGVNTDCTPALEAISFGQSIENLKLLPQIKYKLLTEHPIEACATLVNALRAVCDQLQKLEEWHKSISKFGKINLDLWTRTAEDSDLLSFARSLHQSVQNAIQDKRLLPHWSLYLARRKEATENTLSDFVELLERKDIHPEELEDTYAYCTYNTITRESFRNIPQLATFTGLKHNQIREEFKRLDKKIIALRGKEIAHKCAHNASPPPGTSGARVGDRTEMALLNYLIPQKRPRMAVRKILSQASKSIQELKPCFMMGPQAVAQYLVPGRLEFDLVIMDEASQLKPEEAIGSIARGRQLVVVGDPKQLPPTSFFSQMNLSEDDAENHFTTTEAESILDVCSSHFRPTRLLRWHYRSQHHSLIAFSNHNFYRSNLVIFPSPHPQGNKLGLRAVYLADAIYENQTNLREAKRVVDAVVEHIDSRSNESLGVVTLNIKQRDLIAELLEERLKSVHDADSYRDHWAAEGYPLFVKNLENVQGDERDAIIISTTFGPSPRASSVRQNFGPISRHDGWRRLNVLFTRAKKSIALYTSLRPEDIVVDGDTPDGTKALRNYLEYARTGLLSTFTETNREPDSDFEISVIEMLKRSGYDVTPQLGVSGYRIDIAVKHPDAPSSYLAAIECDGATYHSALSVRDRDRIRQEIIESLGWRGRIWRIWSTDWFRDPKQELHKLISFLENLRKSWKPVCISEGASWIEEGQGTEQITAPLPQQNTPLEPIEDAAQKEREEVGTLLIDTEDDLEVEVGDVVHYIDIANPDDVITVQITKDQDDFNNGIVNESRPLAQAILGAVIDDEVVLHLTGMPSKTFRIVKIIRR